MIFMDVAEIGWQSMDWVNLAQVRVKWWVMNLHIA
jgi:hypothetical protein